MTDRLLLFVFIAALFLSASGCKSSRETTSTTATPQPTPAITAAKPAQKAPAVAKAPKVWEQPPDLESGVPVKTFQVEPPASFTSAQVPDNGIVEFRLTAKAGQVLHLRMHEDEWYPYLLVQGPGIGPRGVTPGGDSEGNRLYTLPETGTYTVVGQHAATQGTNENNTVIQLALLNIDDPLIDPGIRPDQISLDAGDLAANAKWSLIPYSHFEGYADDPWPSHFALQGAHIDFRIMPIAGYKKVVSSEDMERLEAALRANGKGADPKKFPYSGYHDAALEVPTRPRLLQGEGWRGLRWIGQYSQDYVCGFKYLTYVFEGISDDDKLFFMMQKTGVANPEVTAALDKACTDSLRGKNREEEFETFFDKQMPAVFEREISGADPASFQPRLDQLDAIALSLKLKR